jgi:starch-binding outer membrane protein, SusD/RagB family
MKNVRLEYLLFLLLFFSIACDLEIQNPNHPDTERVYTSEEDILKLIGGSFNILYHALTAYLGPAPMLSTTSFQHSTYAAGGGMVMYSSIPRSPIDNRPNVSFANNLELVWYRAYKATADATTGIQRLNSGQITISPDAEIRARAFAKFTQGIAHGYIALLYDNGFIFDESKDPRIVYDMQPAAELFNAASDYLQTAITIATANPEVALPEGWTGGAITNLGELARVAYSYRAYFRTNMPRTPIEAENVDWGAVIDDINKGISEDFSPFADGSYSEWYSMSLYYLNTPGPWSQVNYFILGMADQSGKYQTWLSLNYYDKHPILPGNIPFFIETPDRRFPQGDNETEQRENPGLYITVGDQTTSWGRRDRGAWRWSYYHDNRYHQYYDNAAGGPTPILTRSIMQLIKAEALFHSGDLAGASAIVNITREMNGGLRPALAINEPVSNRDCVPKLPDGSCGNLWEMLKWEKRLESYHVGMGAWYFDGRRWGDHMEGTFLQLPIPGKELTILRKNVYTYGGVGGDWAAPIGTYGF